MEGVGNRFVPNYHHRYNAIPGNPRGASPGALLNGIIRAWPHQDRPWLDLTPEPNADYHCNEPWLPDNNRWMIFDVGVVNLSFVANGRCKPVPPTTNSLWTLRLN